MHNLDHIVWAAPSLAEGVARFEAMTGIRPAPGGRHTTGGTENALVALGPLRYLEIVAPVPGTDARSAWIDFCRASATPRILSFAMRTPLGLAELARRETAVGRAPKGPYDLGRLRSDGVRLDWQLLDPVSSPYGRAVPFFIDWLACEHPSLTAAPGARLEHFEIGHPDPQGLLERFRSLGVDVPVARAEATGFRARLDSPRGTVTIA